MLKFLIMGNKEKKIILKFLIAIIILISIAGIVLTFLIDFDVIKDKSIIILSKIFSYISPTTIAGIIIGVIIKYSLNKSQMKKIDKRLNEVGLDLTITETKEIEKELKNNKSNYFRYKSYIFIEKEDKLIIKFNNEGKNKEQAFLEFKQAFLEFIEYKRRKENQ